MIHPVGCTTTCRLLLLHAHGVVNFCVLGDAININDALGIASRASPS